MKEEIENIIVYLKKMIDKNSSNYLIDNPFVVYTELIKHNNVDRKIAASLLYYLVNTKSIKELTSNKSSESLSDSIQKECSLNKDMADNIALIVVSLFSTLNQKEWKKRKQEGLKQFLDEDFIITWKGFATWDPGEVTVDCHYEAKIILKPTDAIKKHEKLSLMLKKNSFLTKKEIHDYFENSLTKCLDDDFDDYCTCEEYYEPYVEDYSSNLSDEVEKWCKENGFKLMSIDGDGYSDDYEPKHRRGWY